MHEGKKDTPDTKSCRSTEPITLIILLVGVPVGINKLGNCFSVFAKAEDIPYDPKILCLGIPLPTFNSYFTKTFLPKLSNCHHSKQSKIHLH